MIKFNSKYNNLIIMILISILPTIIISVWFFFTNKDTTVNLTGKTLYTIGKEEEKKITSCCDEIIHDMSFLEKIDCVKNLETEKLMEIIEYVKVNRDIYKEICILDKNFNVIYGYNYNNENLKGKKHIINAMSGNESFSDIIFCSNYSFIEAAFPIHNNNNVVGVIYSKIDVSSLNEMLKFSQLIDETTESYIVDKNGTFITESRFIPDAVGKKEVDIKKIKLNIDYSNKTPYLDYRDTLVYGAYFELPYNDWTLIIEEVTNSYKQVIKKL